MSCFSVLSRSGRKSGWASSMPIMVGTITVQVTPWPSIRSIALPGSKSGMNTEPAPSAGMPRIAPIEAAWNIGVWCRKICSALIETTPIVW